MQRPIHGAVRVSSRSADRRSLPQLPVPAPRNHAWHLRRHRFVALAPVTARDLVMLVRSASHRRPPVVRRAPTRRLAISVISFIANFFDTLGIGSFATTTSIVRQCKLIPDERIPGTLNVGYVIPTVIQAYIYTKLVPVDSKTLIR